MQLSSLVALWLAAAPQQELGVDDLIERTPGKVTPPTAAAKSEIGNIPVIQRTCVSSARVADLKAYFTESFKKGGLYVAPEQANYQPERGEQITGLDTENLIAYMALFQPAGKFTTVVIASANIGKPSNVARSSDAVAPVFPGSHSITSYRIETVQGMTYVSPGTPAEIKQFYRETFGKAGYHETEQLVFIKDHTRAWITVSPGVSERNVAVYLQHTADAADSAGRPMVVPPKPTPAKAPGATAAPAPAAPATPAPGATPAPAAPAPAAPAPQPATP